MHKTADPTVGLIQAPDASKPRTISLPGYLIIRDRIFKMIIASSQGLFPLALTTALQYLRLSSCRSEVVSYFASKVQSPGFVQRGALLTDGA